jgi:hypothetical protein
MTDDPRKSASAAERTRAYRERRRAGSFLATVEISAAGISTLTRLGWLSPDRAGDGQAIGEAVLALAGEAAVRGLRPSRAPARA